MHPHTDAVINNTHGLVYRREPRVARTRTTVDVVDFVNVDNRLYRNKYLFLAHDT